MYTYEHSGLIILGKTAARAISETRTVGDLSQIDASQIRPHPCPIHWTDTTASLKKGQYSFFDWLSIRSVLPKFPV